VETVFFAAFPVGAGRGGFSPCPDFAPTIDSPPIRWHSEWQADRNRNKGSRMEDRGSNVRLADPLFSIFDPHFFRVDRPMRKQALTFWAVIAGLALASTLFSAEEKDAYRLKPNDPIPGPFQALSVVVPATTPKPMPQPNRLHCPVCEYRLSPAVLIFARQLDEADNAPLAKLLKKLDAFSEKHPDAQLGICAVYNDGGYLKAIEKEIEEGTPAKEQELSTAIDAKDEMVAKLKKLAKAADFKHVSLSLGSPSNYQVPPNTDLRVLFYDKHLAVSDNAYARDKLTDAEIDKIVSEVEGKVKGAQKENKQ
jgi:hypothetical protein